VGTRTPSSIWWSPNVPDQGVFTTFFPTRRVSGPRSSHLGLAINSGIAKAFGKPGEPGDIDRIEHLASRVADAYEQALDWTLEFHRLAVEPDLERLIRLACDYSKNMLTEIDEFSNGLYERLRQGIANHTPGDVLTFNLTLTAPDSNTFFQELKKVFQPYS
jgi:hypothetical protein